MEEFGENPSSISLKNIQVIEKETEIDKQKNKNNEYETQRRNSSIKPINNEPMQSDKKWNEYTRSEKISYIFFSSLKIIIFIVLLYLFLLSLNFMTIGFTLVSSVALKGGDVIRFILSNPFAALAIGIIITAIMQNETATTSIAVSMVGAGIIPDVKNAIPIIMGSNIGTCFTNSLIALTLANDPNEFKRAFSAATLNDMFNFLTTTVLLPVEIFSSFLFVVSEKLTNTIPFENADQIAKANFIGAILNPLTDVFILLNTSAIDALTKGDTSITEIALRCCQQIQILENQTISVNSNRSIENVTVLVNATKCIRECNYWCIPMLRSFGDAGTGLFWIILSIAVLIACLFGIVKVLSLLIVGPIAKGVRKGLNASLPGKMKWFTQVILFIVTLLLTLVVQSSNIITATLVLLCGIGLISLQRVYVMTLGSNIGTTVTGILSAFTLAPSAMKKGLQLAFVYTFFNLLGVIFWLPVPIFRFPKRLARKLGEIVFEYRWFLYVYIFSVYDSKMKTISCCKRKNKVANSIEIELDRIAESGRNTAGEIVMTQALPRLIRRMSSIDGLIGEGERKVSIYRMNSIKSISSSRDERD